MISGKIPLIFMHTCDTDAHVPCDSETMTISTDATSEEFIFALAFQLFPGYQSFSTFYGSL
ncbi:MAG: hypothetical protein J6E46_04080, partial [Faecalicoccus sp.]|nr:hypothetical protein [Faecalicoccus sp.]